MSYPSGWPPMPIAGGNPGRRVQYAALPYRVRRDGEVQIRLITSRETRRWVIPKGWPMKGLSPPKAAARECYEEAGLLGVIAREPLGMYTYEKNLGTRSVLCDVLVFPLKVKRHLQKWPERFQRYGFWFSIDSAAAAVQEEDLGLLIRAFGDVMARRREAKLQEAAQPPKKEKAAKEKPVMEGRASEGEAAVGIGKPDKTRKKRAAAVEPAEAARMSADVEQDAPTGTPTPAKKAEKSAAKTAKRKLRPGAGEAAVPKADAAKKAVPAKKAGATKKVAAAKIAAGNISAAKKAVAAKATPEEVMTSGEKEPPTKARRKDVSKKGQSGGRKSGQT